MSFELRESFTDFDLSYCKKLIRFKILNTCGVVCMVHFLVNNEILDLKNLASTGALIYDAVFLILGTNCSLLFGLIDPLYILKVYKRYRMLQSPKNCKLL